MCHDAASSEMEVIIRKYSKRNVNWHGMSVTYLEAYGAIPTKLNHIYCPQLFPQSAALG